MNEWMTEQETAWILGLAPCEVSILVKANLLEPLTFLADRGRNYFEAADLGRLNEDVIWYAKAREAILEFWRRRAESNR